MRHAAVLAVALLAGAAMAASDAVVTLHYQVRPPYSSPAASGAVEGLVASPAGEALRRAGLTVRWVETPAQRQLALIQGGSGRHCGLGWFRNAEREASGKFSQALYRDQPFGAIVRSELPIASGIRSSDLIADARYAVLVKEGFSYGPQLDARLARAAAAVHTSAALASMAAMVRADRAAWMLATPEEAEALLAPGLRRITFSDLPAGQTRHLYCSRDVPADWLARFDRALAPGR
jgi:polar amino acid transport system substrate-binding protein